MAYVVARSGGTWEIRESRSTSAGPRSRTLATFRMLTPEIVEKACRRSSKALDSDDLRKAALRVGAPIVSGEVDRAGAALLAELAVGRRPRGVLCRLLLDALQPDQPNTTSDNAQAAARWVTATPQQRGETLRDLLLLADRLPPSPAAPGRCFPRVQSKPA